MTGLGLLAVVAVTAPAWAALLGLVAGRHREVAVGFGVLGAGVALVAALAEAVATWDGRSSVVGVPLLGWVDTGDAVVQLSLRSDALSGLVSVAVTLVALCVQVYSAGYLRGAAGAVAAEAPPTRYRAYAATVSLFTAAMLLVVHADDLLLLLVGWEVMGLCSYLLVGHHSERRAARAAAAKAFLVTRVGDVGFLLGVVVLLAAAGTTSISGLLGSAVVRLDPATTTLACLLLLAGVVGKSAQFPLHTWLPDAMEGPTPVSALIHAATMVAAGVFVVARLYPLFAAAPAALAVLAAIASVTMVGAALAALAQEDLKRLLAWSTISQVALMLAALAVGATGQAQGHGRPAALAHLLSHAGFKALLFLAAGVVTHLVGSTLLKDMGGLRHQAPVAAATFAVGLAALAGLPPTSGFVSKEAVLSAAEQGALHGGGSPAYASVAAWLVLLAGLATTLVTATYATRAFCMVVLGPVRVRDHLPQVAGEPPPEPHGHALAREMTVPLAVLAVPAAALGLLFWADPAATDGLHLSWATSVVGTLLAVAGVAIGWTGMRSATRDVLDGAAGRAGAQRARALARDGYGADAALVRLAVRPLRRLAALVAAGDRDVVDAYVRGSATGAGWAGRLLRHVQTGAATTYLTWALGGALLLGLGVVWR